jgi:hypothetical protein
MSEEQAPYKVQVKELLDDTNIAAGEVARLPQALAGRHCQVTPVSLTLEHDITYTEFANLIRYMDNMAYAHSVRDILFKFYIGDAFNCGEEILGEKYAQVMDQLHWSQGYISNIQWVCRNVPPGHRDIKLSNWKFWTHVAPLADDEQRHWVKEGLIELGLGEGWFERVRKRLEAWKLRQELDSIDDPELKRQIEEAAEGNELIKWPEVRNWIENGRAGKKLKGSAEWWMDALDEEGIEGEVRETVFRIGMAFVDACKKREIRPEGGQKVWKV